jgi:hypothetical protein
MRGQAVNVVVAVCVAGVVGVAGAERASAEYTISASSGGLSSVNAAPGQTVNVDVVLTSNAADVHNSAIFRVVFSEPGIEYLGYSWSSPYSMLFDGSTPDLASLPGVITASTLSGLAYPSGIADVEMSNVTDSGVFTCRWVGRARAACR